MPLIPTRVHAMMDYLMGFLLIAAPWLFQFSRGGAETWVPVVLGAGAILYSMFTDYELGVVRAIDMRVHLGLDAMSGGLLAVSPWLFGFSELVWLPHVLFGLAEIAAAVTTQTTPSTSASGRQSISGAG